MAQQAQALQAHDDHAEGHGHSHTQVSVDLYNTEQAFKAVKFSTAIMLITALIQFGLMIVASSAGVLADALHNTGDIFTTVALWAAFSVSRREANRRYTYGYNRAEDVAGIVIVLVIIASALASGWESVAKLVAGEIPTNIWLGLIGAVVGVAGNEIAAQYKIRVGKQINSVPLVADGQHSRMDGLTSGAAFIGLIAAALGFKQADPIAGIIITIVIAFVVVESVKSVLSRLLDAVDPHLVDELEHSVRHVAGVKDVTDFRVRWFGRNLQVSLNAAVDSNLSVVEGHNIAEEIRHALLHEDGVSLVDVHIDPYDPTNSLYHASTQHHLTGEDEHDEHNHHEHGHDEHDHHDHDKAHK